MNVLSRRTLLRGFGTALGLPLLEAMLPSALRALPSAIRADEPATRLAYVYVPNGVETEHWRPSATGADFELPSILEPLAPLRADLSVLTGLTCDKARANGDGPGDHARAAAAFLTGVQPLKSASQVRLGPSADQIAAAAVGDATRLRSLELGCERGRRAGDCDSGYACAYSTNVSWIDEATPAGKETDPRRAFDRLFRDGGGESQAARRARAERDKSVVDFVRADALRLESKLGAADRRKLDQFFESVRELERRIDFAKERIAAEVPDEQRPSDEEPADLGAHVRLMSDLVVLAFQTDSTRIATLMVANEGSNRSYRELEIADGHHTISHHGGDAAKREQIRRINRYHVEQLAHLVRGLAEAREGDARLLDRAMLVYGSGIADGNRHDHHDVPILLAGRGNGTLHPGRHVRFPKETPLSDLHLALLERMSVRIDTFGDARGRLEGI